MSLLSQSLVNNPDLDTWIRIDPSDTITVFTGKVELGQGLRAAIARIAAEELDVPLEMIRVETADTARGPNEGFTAGSQSMSDGGTAVRQASAAARAHLLELGAAELDSAPSAVTVQDGVIAGPDGRTTTYWELFGGRRFGFVIDGSAELKHPEDYRFVGKPGQRPDLVGLITGTLPFVQDLRLPGMLFGRVVRPPSPAAVFESVDPAPARALPGVVEVICDGGFLGVVAEREEQAVAAADALRTQARWLEHESLPIERDIYDWLLAQPSRDFHVVDGVPLDEPIPPIATTHAAQTLEATYTRPYQMHGSIGPSAAAAVWEEGDLTVWTAMQGPFPLRISLAEALSIPVERVRVVHVEGSGCYGHNGAEDASLDAVLLARAVPGRPVLLKWSREDEHAWEPYGPAMVVKMRAGLDTDGNLVDWNHDVWGTTHNSRAFPHGERTMLLAGLVPRSAGTATAARSRSSSRRRACTETPTRSIGVPRRRIVKHFVETMPLAIVVPARARRVRKRVRDRVVHGRAARAQPARDPLEFRLAYLDDDRARAVLTAAAERAGWRGRSDEFGRGMGIGFARYKNIARYAAVIVELAVERRDGRDRDRAAW